MGSGTTAIAASNLGRDFIGIEISPDYIKLAEKRYKEI
jgi:site-specific DNA-methyltransferase (adenine-specific)